MTRIKKFRAPSVSEALIKIREEMGDDAMVLGTMRRKIGKSKVVEVVAATDGNLRGAGAASKSGEQTISSSGEITTMQKIDREIIKELKHLEERLHELLCNLLPPVEDDRSEKQRTLHKRLSQLGLDRELIDDLLFKDGNACGSSFRSALLRILDEVCFDGTNEKISIFVGPSGAGKTTSALKVAGVLLVPNKRKPRLIYFGSNPPRDEAWIRRSAKKMGIKFEIVTNEKKLLRILEKERKSPILIDTCGMSRMAETELSFICDVARKREDARIRLVVDSGMDASNILALASCISAQSRTTLVLTKLDEARRIGGALSASILANLPIAYLAGGSDVDAGIYLPTREILMKRILESTEATGW